MSTDLPPAPTDHALACPGCGGRNPPGATECDWCGRPFVSRGRRLRLTAWQILSTLLLLALAGGILGLAVLNAGRTLPAPRTGPPTPPPAATPLPTPAVTPRVTALPTATPPPPPTATPGPPPPTEPPDTPTPTPALARVANTGGRGATLRSEPGPQARPLAALREGTRLLLTGGEESVAARPWREVETEDHRLKGWVAADLLQPVP